jgi:hypothetical protein
MLNDNELLFDPKYPKQVTKSISSEKKVLNKNGPCESLNHLNAFKVRTEDEGTPFYAQLLMHDSNKHIFHLILMF